VANKARSEIAARVGSFAEGGARILFLRGDVWAKLDELAGARGMTAEQLFGLCVLFAIEYPDEVTGIDPGDVMDSI